MEIRFGDAAMGTKFFQKAPTISGGGNLNMESRALNSNQYAARASAGAAQKDLAAAQALYKAHGFKPQQRGAAYPKGPKT